MLRAGVTEAVPVDVTEIPLLAGTNEPSDDHAVDTFRVFAVRSSSATDATGRNSRLFDLSSDLMWPTIGRQMVRAMNRVGRPAPVTQTFALSAREHAGNILD